MATLFGLFRIGNDPVIRYTQKGDAVLGLSLAYTYGRKGDDGRKPSQWVDGSLWGKQAEALSPYLVKGGSISCTIEDLHIEEYEGKNGAGHKLVGRVVSLEFAGGAKHEPTPQQKPAPKQIGHFEFSEEDIPF